MKEGDFYGSEQSAVIAASTTVKIEMVNADSGDPKVEAFQVKGYPTFCLQTTDGKITEYKGKREVAGYLEFLNSSLGGGV
jgi:hypothetical protein